MILEKELRAIHYPYIDLTTKNWGKEILSAYRDYFIVPRKSKQEILDWLKENFNIEKINYEDITDKWTLRRLNHVIEEDGYTQQLGIMKSMDDEIWVLPFGGKNEDFYFEENLGMRSCHLWREIGSEQVLLTYNKDSDTFSSTSRVLEMEIAYYRGINKEDVDADSRELYPVKYGLSYVVNLYQLTDCYIGNLALKVINNIFESDYLVLESEDTKKTLKKEEYGDTFREIFIDNDGDNSFDSAACYERGKTLYTFSFYKNEERTCVLEYTDDKRLYYDDYFFFGLYEEEKHFWEYTFPKHFINGLIKKL